MLGRLIMIFIIPMIVYFTIYPGLQQAANDIVNCNSTNYTFSGNNTLADIFHVQQTQSPPPGETQSFGGAGGDYRFGGYNGEVTHREFPTKPVVTTNKSGEECYGLDESQKQLISMAPILLLISTGVVMYFMYRNFYWNFIGGYDDI